MGKYLNSFYSNYKLIMPNGKMIQENLPEMFQTKWGKLLADVDQNNFVLGSILKAMFADKVDLQYAEMLGLSIAQVTPAKVSMIFGGFPNKKEHNKFVKLAQAELGDDFVVKAVNGDHTSNRKVEEETKKVVAKAQKDGKRVLLISRDMGSRSFSVPQIDTVFLMYDNGMLSQTVQKVSRVFTPGKTYTNDDKTKGTVITLSFDSNRVKPDPFDQYIINEALRISNGDESLQDSIKRVARSFNIFTNDENGLAIQLNSDAYADEMVASTDLNDIAELSVNTANIDWDMLGNGFLDSRNVVFNTNNEDKVEVDIKNVRTYIETPSSPSEPSDNPTDEMNDQDKKQLIENIMYFNANITSLIVYDKYENTDLGSIVSSLRNKGFVEDVEGYYGLSFGLIEKLIVDNVVPVRLLNTILQSKSNKVEEFAW
jgi:hypothetical protein